MKTPEFHSMDPVASKQLTMVFPFFFMCIYLLPLYYMVTKLSEERESKAREGMKMMGLNDGSYFTSWWIFLLLIISMMSGLTVLTSSFNVLVNSDKLRVLAFCILYGMTFYGFAFAVVAFLPNRKTSATAASIAHLLSYYVAFMYQGYSATNRSKLIAALIPNCAMSFMVNHLF
jgi:ATP-binding cassette subfamily A (ABC1) protein 3